MDAHGGWIATARDLVRLLTAVDAFPSRPDVLSPATIQIMTTPSATNAGYAKGWSVNPAGTWWHGGSLDGSYSWMVRTSSQFSSQVAWAVIMNKRTEAAGFQNAASNLGFGNCVNSTTTFPTHDLFDVPTQNASAMNFSNITSNSMTVNWTNGNGDGRVLIMRSGGAPNKFPLDGTDYNPQQDLGEGNIIVYSGTGGGASVSDLTTNTNYQFRLFEYKKNANTGNNALYQLAGAANGSQNTLSANASVTVRGRVLSGNGRGVAGARVSLTNANGETRMTLTNPFGYYRFMQTAAGGTYTFNISHKRHTFAPQVLTVTGEINDLNFTAQ